MRSDLLEAGRLWGVIVTFDGIGDKLLWHTHKPADAHITIVAKGTVRVDSGSGTGEQKNITSSHDLSEGQCIDTAAGVYHEFMALTDGARIFNIVKQPKP